MFVHDPVVIIPVVVFLVALLAFFHFAKFRKKAALWGAGSLWALFTLIMIVGMETASGWDGLGFLLALIGISAPAAAGFGIGGVAGWIKGRKDMHA